MLFQQRIFGLFIIGLLMTTGFTSCSKDDDPTTQEDTPAITLEGAAFSTTSIEAQTKDLGYALHITFESEAGTLVLQTQTAEAKQYTLGENARAIFLNEVGLYESLSGTVTLNSFENSIVDGTFDVVLTRTDERDETTQTLAGSFTEVAVGETTVEEMLHNTWDQYFYLYQYDHDQDGAFNHERDVNNQFDETGDCETIEIIRFTENGRFYPSYDACSEWEAGEESYSEKWTREGNILLLEDTDSQGGIYISQQQITELTPLTLKIDVLNEFQPTEEGKLIYHYHLRK